MMGTNKSGFTLIEILITLGILAVLITVIVLILNPAQFIAQSRDSIRMNDIQNLDKAISLSKAMNSFTDSTESKKVYISLPDTNDILDDDCRASGEYPTLPALETGWEYRCAADSDNFRNIDGTGWIPIDFASVPSIQPPLITLPVDPLNNPANFDYYTYSWETDKNVYALTAKLDSEKYIGSSAAKDGGNDDTILETRPIAWSTTGTSSPIFALETFTPFGDFVAGDTVTSSLKLTNYTEEILSGEGTFHVEYVDAWGESQCEPYIGPFDGEGIQVYYRATPTDDWITSPDESLLDPSEWSEGNVVFSNLDIAVGETYPEIKMEVHPALCPGEYEFTFSMKATTGEEEETHNVNMVSSME